MKKLYIVYNDFPKHCLEKLKTKYNLTIRETKDIPTEEEYLEIMPNHDAAIIGISRKMTDCILSSIGDKDFTIATLSIGLDHIEKSFFKEPNIRVLSLVDSNVISVAEHTVAMYLSLFKNLPSLTKSTFAHIDRKDLGYRIRDIYGKTIGIIGAGKIAHKVIEYSKPFGVKFLCHTAHPENHQDLSSDVEFCDLDHLLKNSDVVSVHVPLSNETNNLLSIEKLNLMKPDAVFVNTSRVQIADNAHLATMLKNNKLYGVGLDIDVHDYDIIDHFQGITSAILTPHVAGVTAEAIMRMYEEITEKLLKE